MGIVFFLQNIKNKILTEYTNLRQDPKYQEQKKRCDYLHKKLAYIKKLIATYDNMDKLSSSATGVLASS